MVRLRKIQTSSVYNLINLPTSGDTDDGLEPFSGIQIEINPDDYPIKELEGSASYHSGYEKKIFARITKVDDIRQTFRLFAQGSLILAMKATENNQTNVDFSNETYSWNGTTFVIDSQNRDDKDVDFYYPAPEIVEIRLKITLKNPYYLLNKESFKTNEL